MKTHASAVVAIPPTSVQPPIQELRRQYDRHVDRWMPHVTLIYPFRPCDEFPSLLEPFREALQGLRSFEIELATFRSFEHRPRSHTIWLAPEPAAALVELQDRLQRAVPDCNDVTRHANGYTPHLSVGQFRGSAHEVETFLTKLSAGWKPVSFRLDEVSLIYRNAPPDDVFRVDSVVPLAPPASARASHPD